MARRRDLPLRRLLAVVMAAAVTASVVALANPASAATAEPTASAGTVITGRITDPAGNPLVGVAIEFQNGESLFTTAPVATTGTDGQYRAVLTPAEGDSYVRFDGHDATGPSSAAGYVTGFLTDADGSKLLVRATPGARVRGDGTLARGGGVRGRVSTSDGQPLGGVFVLPVSNAAFDDGGVVAVTAADGTWQITGIDLLGASTLRATFEFSANAATGGHSLTGYPDACLGLVASPCDRRTYDGPTPAYVAIRPGVVTTGADIALPAAAAAHGRVTDSAGRGITGVTIGVFGPVVARRDGSPWDASRNTVETDTQGNWHADHLLPQTYAVCYGWYGQPGTAPSPNGYTTECSHNSPRSAGPRAGHLYPITSGRDITVTDTLTARGAVSGHVVDAAGNPIAQATVKIGYLDARGAFPPNTPMTRTRRDGTYTVVGIDAGRPVVCASEPQHFADVCPPANGATPLTTVVRPDATTTDITIVLEHRTS